MEHRVLGRTGIEVSEVGLGGAFLAEGSAEYAQAEGAVRTALDLGVTYIDTAPMYGNSEEVLGRILKGVSGEIVLSTKLGYQPQPFDPRSRDCLLGSFENSLRLLGRDYVDILMIHEPDRVRQFDFWDDREAVTGPVLDLMQDLRGQGRIGALGIGGTTAYELAGLVRSEAFDVVLTAFNYSLLWQEAAIEIIPGAHERNMGIVSGSPLQQGALVRRYDVDRETWMSRPRREQYHALYALVDECGIPLRELCHRFVMSDSRLTTMLTGGNSTEQVAENLGAACKGPLDREILRRIDEIYRMVPFRPYEEPFGLPFNREYPGVGPAVR